MAQLQGIEDFDRREFNPDYSPRHEYVEGWLHALAYALAQHDATKEGWPRDNPDMDWITHFDRDLAVEVFRQGYMAGWQQARPNPSTNPGADF